LIYSKYGSFLAELVFRQNTVMVVASPEGTATPTPYSTAKACGFYGVFS